MRAIRVERPGGPEVLVPTHVPVPMPGARDVLVRVHAIGVNFADLMCRAGAYPGRPAPPPIPGCEASGIVDAVGAEVRAYRPGDRVGVYSPPGGAYAEWIASPESHILPLPDSMSFEDGAAFLHVFLTAYHALRTLGRASEGEWVVVSAAAGGVGTAVLQLARAWRLRVIAGVGSPEKLDVVRRFGATQAVDYANDSLRGAVMEATGGRGADVVLESVGGRVLDDAVVSLAPLGRVVVFGVASGERAARDVFFLHRTSSSLALLNLSVWFAHARTAIGASWQELTRMYDTGAVRPFVSARLRLEDAAEAHRRIEGRGTVGKLVLVP